MKKVSFIVLLCLSILFLNVGCSDSKNTAADTFNEIKVESDIPLSEQDNQSSDTTSDEISASAVDLSVFWSLEEFQNYISSTKREDDIVDLAALEYYYLPTGIPSEYKLYKITAGASDIGFWYLPDNMTSSKDAILEAESLQKHFLFISSRGSYEFSSILEQFGSKRDSLQDGKYLVPEEISNMIIWEQNGVTLMMYLPIEYTTSSIRTLCATDKYVKSSNTQEFECTKD